MLEKIKKKIKYFSQNTLAVMVGICVLTLPVTLFFVFWLRLFYEFEVASPLVVNLIAYLIFSLTSIGIYLIVKYAKKQIHVAGFFLIMLCGSLYAFATTPLQVPDEENHFLRTYALASGEFTFDPARDYPYDVDVLFEMFDPLFNYYRSPDSPVPVEVNTRVTPSLRVRPSPYRCLFYRISQPLLRWRYANFSAVLHSLVFSSGASQTCLYML